MRHRMLLVWVVGFVGGILLQSAHADGLLPLWLGLGAVGFGLILACGRKWTAVILGIALTGLAGGALRLAVSQTVPPTDLSRRAGPVAPVILTGSVVSDPQIRHAGRVTLLLRAEQIEQHGATQTTTGETYVTLTPQALANTPLPDYGDRLLLGGQLSIPAGSTNPGAFSWRDYLARRSVWCELDIKRPGGYRKLGGSALNPFLRLAWHVRQGVLTAVKRSLPSAQAAMLSGILFGVRTSLPPDLMADFVHTSTVHILASAGLHVGVVAFWALFLCERLTLPRKASAMMVICTLCLFALMAGGRPSVTRAVVMAVVYFGALLFEREPDLPTTLAAAALFILLIQPTALFEAGFQMSFLTVLTLALAMPVWLDWWRPRLDSAIPNPLPRKVVWWFVELAGLSLLAQVGSLPIVGLDYNEVSLSGFFANTLVVPLLFLVIPLGFLGAGLWSLWPSVGTSLLHVTGFGLSVISFLVRSFGETPWSYRAIVTPNWLFILGYYAAVFGLAFLLSRKQPAEVNPVPLSLTG